MAHPEKRFVNVEGRRMAYVEEGAGHPIVFLHGNPTSSYLWRNVLPHVRHLGRCLAPDLLGMGDSDKVEGSGPGSYRFFDHRRALDALLEAVGADRDVTLVVHDWGSALGFDWAQRHHDAVRAIAYMEAIVAPMSWSEFGAAQLFQALRSDEGERLILEENVFVEQILPSSILRTLTEEEMDEYRRPFVRGGEDRRPTLSWPRELPFDGEPADVVDVVRSYATWLEGSSVPKLFVNAEPGALLVGERRERCRRWPNQQEVTVSGIHFIQEDSPDEIGKALAAWLADLAT